ncbi:MAG: hypothetical protein ACJ788_22435 [Ktedonobacteraceae bacterium]
MSRSDNAASVKIVNILSPAPRDAWEYERKPGACTKDELKSTPGGRTD